MLLKSFYKIILFVFVLSCVSNTISGQVLDEKQVISMEGTYLNVIKENKNVLETIENYNLLCRLYQKTNIDKSNHYADELRLFSIKNKKNKGLIYYYLIKAYNAIYKGQYNEAIRGSKKAVFYLKDEFYTDLYLEAIYYQLVANYFLGNHEHSIKLGTEAIKGFEKSKVPKQIGLLHNLVAANYSSLEKLHLSLNHLDKSAEFFIKAKDKHGLMNSYNQIADVYLRVNLTLDALHYSNKALTIAKELGNVDMQSYTILLLFNTEINLAMRDLEKANANLVEVKNNLNSIPNKGLESAYLLLKAEYFMLKSNYTAALYFCNEAQKLDTDYEFSKQKLQYKLAKCYHKLGDFKKAQTYFQQLELKLKQSKFKYHGFDIANFYSDFAKNEKLLGNYTSAIDYLQLHSKWLNLKEELGNNVKTRFLLNRYDLSQKNIELKNNVLERQRIELLLKNSNDKVYFFVTVLCFTLLLFLFFLYRYIKEKYYNNLLKEKNVIIEEKNSVIENTILELEQMLTTQEVLLKEVHHRVKNNLQLIVSLLRNQVRTGGIEDVNDFVEKTKARIESIALLHQNLYKSDAIDKIDLEEYITDLSNNILLSLGKDSKKMEVFICAKNIFLNVSLAIPIGLIINEIVTNALKYAYPNSSTGILEIDFKMVSESNYKLIITDYGVGISAENRQKKTFGLELIALLAAQIDADLIMNTNNGVQYILTFNSSEDE